MLVRIWNTNEPRVNAAAAPANIKNIRGRYWRVTNQSSTPPLKNMKAATARPTSALCARDMIANHGCWMGIWSGDSPESADMVCLHEISHVVLRDSKKREMMHSASYGMRSAEARSIFCDQSAV